MKPADMGNWGLLQVVQEGGRLLRHHSSDFMPANVMGILPACFINVVYAQIRHMDFVSPPGVDTQGSTEETASMFRYAYLFVQALVMAVSNLFILVGGMLMFNELTNVVYNSHVAVDTTTTRHTESLLVSMKLALVGKDVETANLVLWTTTTERSLYHQFLTTSKRKKLKALIAIIALFMLYFTSNVVGESFLPKAMATMGLSLWMAILVTLHLTLLVTLWTSYLILVYLVIFVWLSSSSLESHDPETGFCEHAKCATLKIAVSSNSHDKEEKI